MGLAKHSKSAYSDRSIALRVKIRYIPRLQTEEWIIPHCFKLISSHGRRFQSVK
jgi:hypothetical protein